MILKHNSKKNKKGMTLVELLVYSALLLMVFTGIYMIFESATKYYYLSIASIDVQQSVLTASYRLSQELSESSLNSVKLYNTTPKGIIFMSPRDSSGNVSLQTPSPYIGKVSWHKHIAYYLSGPDSNGLYDLCRAEQTSSPSPSETPFAATDTSWFPSTGDKIIAQNIVYTGDPVFYYGAKLTTGTISGPIYINITARVSSHGQNNDIQTTDSTKVMN